MRSVMVNAGSVKMMIIFIELLVLEISALTEVRNRVDVLQMELRRKQENLGEYRERSCSIFSSSYTICHKHKQ